MKTNQADFPVRAMCRVLDLSPSGYYAWLDREPSARAKRDEELTERIQTVWRENRRVYGRPRIYADLKEAGRDCGSQPETARPEDDQAQRGRPSRAGSHRAGLQRRRARPVVGGRHHLHPDLGGVLVPRGCARRLEQAGDRVVDGYAPAHRARPGRAEHGDLAAPARMRHPSQ